MLTFTLAVCLAQALASGNEIPRIPLLINWLVYACRERDATFYGRPDETNAAVRGTFFDLMLSAPVDDDEEL